MVIWILAHQTAMALVYSRLSTASRDIKVDILKLEHLVLLQEFIYHTAHNFGL